jgi:hypothetical protein
MKVYKTGSETLVAACDADLLGRTLREGVVKLFVNPAFYDGREVEAEEFIASLRMATMGNFVGEETVRIAQGAGFVDEGGILTIQGVPHAQMFVL